MKIVKLIKQMNYNKNGEAKINCYHVNISKTLITEAGLQNIEEVKIYAKDGKIIIEKA